MCLLYPNKNIYCRRIKNIFYCFLLRKIIFCLFTGIMTLSRGPCDLDNMSLFQDLKLKRRKVDSRCSSDGELTRIHILKAYISEINNDSYLPDNLTFLNPSNINFSLKAKEIFNGL